MNLTSSLNIEFNRLTLRLEHIFHLDAISTRDALPEAVRHVFKSDFEEVEATLRRAGVVGPGNGEPLNAQRLEQAILARAEDEPEAVGWLVKGSQREFRVEDNCELHFSWQPIRTAWFHALTYQAAVDIACAWADDYYRQAWGEDGRDASDEA